jgi:F-type H+-transporting ATPase subunit b
LTVRGAAFSILLLALLAAPFLLAQEKAAEPAKAQPAQAEPAKSAQPAEGQSASGGKELVEASKEAETGKHEEEEDEEAQFKYSASVQWLARHTGLSTHGAYILALCVNFAVVAGFIAWAVKKSAPIHFRNRTAEIRKQLEEARAASDDANRRLADIEGRLGRLNAELAEMRAAAERDAAAEEERLRAAAEEDRQKVVATAEQEIVSAAKVARAELKKYAAEIAISLAEKKIQVTPQTDQALVRNFVADLTKEGKA